MSQQECDSYASDTDSDASSVVAPSFSPIKSIDADSEHTAPLCPVSGQGDIAIPSCTTPTASNPLCLVSTLGDIAIPSYTTPKAGKQ